MKYNIGDEVIITGDSCRDNIGKITKIRKIEIHDNITMCYTWNGNVYRECELMLATPTNIEMFNKERAIKFEIGEKVVVREDLCRYGTRTHPGINADMKSLIGSTVTIAKVIDNGNGETYAVFENRWKWNNLWLERQNEILPISEDDMLDLFN